MYPKIEIIDGGVFSVLSGDMLGEEIENDEEVRLRTPGKEGVTKPGVGFGSMTKCSQSIFVVHFGETQGRTDQGWW